MATAAQSPRGNEREQLSPLLKVRDVSRICAVSPSTVYRWIEDSTLPAVRVGRGAIRVSPEALQRWIAGNDEWRRTNARAEMAIKLVNGFLANRRTRRVRRVQPEEKP